ncbi:MAG: flippase-like domain-containing protein, partial [Clostridia bacterium]|nr:flippase-like domain-containing protein [Clostridia bacterium]
AYNQFIAIIFFAGLCSYYLRLGVSAGLIWFLFTRIELESLAVLSANITWGYLLVALFLALMAMPYSAYKWQPLLKAQGLHYSLGKLTRIYFLGLFFNNFLPSSIGGDVVRVYQSGKEGRDYEKAAASVLVERLLATVGLVLVGLVAALFSLTSRDNVLLAGLILGGVGLTLGVILYMALYLLPGQRGEQKQLRPWQEKLYQVGAAVKLYRGNNSLLFKVVWLSAGFQLIVVAINYYLFLALGRPVSFLDCALYIPVISALAMVPFSINGLGVREGAYVYFFAQTGLDGTVAIAGSLLFFFVVMAASLPGGVYFALEGKAAGYGETYTLKQA